MNPDIKRRRIRVWICIAGVFVLLAIIGAIAPEEKSVTDARNSSAWEKNLREGAQIVNGPLWRPTAADEAVFHSSAKASAERYGAPPPPKY